MRRTAREFAFLEYALRHPGKLLTRALILEHVWDDNFDPVANAVDGVRLEVVRWIAEQHGETLQIERVGQVNQIWIRIPAQPEESSLS